MKLKSIVAAALGAGMLASSAYAVSGISFDTLRIATVKQIESTITLAQEGIELLRDYYNHQGVYMPVGQISVDFDRGALDTMINSQTGTTPADQGALVLTFKSSATDENASKVLDGKLIVLKPTTSGSYASYDDLNCFTNITLSTHHNATADTADTTSKLLRFTDYYGDMECKYVTNPTNDVTAY